MEDKGSLVGKIIGLAYPFIFGAASLYLAYRYDVTYKIPNFDKVLDGAITFSSIVVGFLGALLGILISIKDSEVVDSIFRSKEKSTLKYYFYEPFLLGLAVVVSSAFMHVMRAYDNRLSSDVTFYIWLLVTVWFLPSTFRVVNNFMSVFFASHINTGRPAGNSETDLTRRQERRDRLTRQPQDQQSSD
ncbi:hypothetical protein BSK64_06180 [Paenibacillus odorifer]|uniref:hypothetical protein n=1 Tax=Paenibacillus odorifer TaxID=189426 RepID=UPI00096ED20A|nr:hypothetical protein [Paenibacillus odorifer]OME07842.1 hypothetical protein BSK64_06180 [Paenibacillus odorifer]